MNGDRMITAKGEGLDRSYSCTLHNTEFNSHEKRTGVSHNHSEESSASTTRIKAHGDSLKRKISSY